MDAVLFTVIECIILFALVYFFIISIKLPGETKNKNLDLLGALGVIIIFIINLKSFTQTGSLYALAIALLLVQCLFMALYTKYANIVFLGIGTFLAIIFDLMVLYIYLNANNDLILLITLIIAAIYCTIKSMLFIVEKRTGRRFGWKILNRI